MCHNVGTPRLETLSHQRNWCSEFWELFSGGWMISVPRGPTFIWIVPGRSLQERDASSKRHVLLVFLLEAGGAARFPVSLSFLALHLLFVDSPPLELLRPPLLRRAQPLKAGHLVQLLKLLDQLQVVGHGAGGGGCCRRTDVWGKRLRL